MVNSSLKNSFQIGDVRRLGYLSWSKMQLFKKDRNLFYQVYIEGQDQFRTKYLELGKTLAKALEGDEQILEQDPMLRYIKAIMPAYDKPEYKMDTVVEGVPIRFVPDTFNSRTKAFREYKSGKLWTPSMANKHGQMKFYATGIYYKYGVLLNHCYLDWAKTEEDEKTGELYLTGDVTSFKVEIKMRDIILTAGEMVKTWKEIQEFLKFVGIKQ